MAAAKGKSVKVSDDLTLKLPAKLPFTVALYVTETAIEFAPFLNEVLGEEQAAKVWDAGLSLDEGRELVFEILGKYGVDAGK